MKLIIVEKGSLARNIAKAIGIKKNCEGYIECVDDYIVTNAIGHLLELKQPRNYPENNGKKWREYNLPFIPNEFIYEVRNDSGIKKQLKVIKDLMTKADE